VTVPGHHRPNLEKISHHRICHFRRWRTRWVFAVTAALLADTFLHAAVLGEADAIGEVMAPAKALDVRSALLQPSKD
jgi:hypothetical protein